MKNIPNTQLYCVEVPKDAFQFEKEIEKEDDWFQLLWHDTIKDEESGFYGECVELNEDIGFDFEILGEIDSEQISFDVELYVKSKYKVTSSSFQCTRYFNYLENEFKEIYKNDSFRSLLQSHGIQIKENTKLLILIAAVKDREVKGGPANKISNDKSDD